MKGKRWLAFALSAVMVFTCGGSAFASEQMEDADTEMLSVCATGTEIVDSGTCGDDLTWTLDDEGTFTISGEGEMTNYFTNSDVPWYDNRTSIKNVVVENGVTTIGSYAFSYCTSLEQINLNEGLETIEAYAFSFCSYLAEVTIPDSVVTIGSGAFSVCSSLETIYMGSGITSIDSNTFFHV